MRRLLLSLVAACVGFSAFAYDAPNLGIKNARTLTVADMTKPPISAAAFTQCNLLIAAFFTLQSGEFVKIDVAHHEGVAYDDAMKWGDTALSGAVRVEATCDDPGKMMHTADTPAASAATEEHTVVVRESVCGELLAMIVSGPHSLEVIQLKKKTPKEASDLVKSVKAAKEAGAPVYDVELEEGCART